MSNLVPSAPIEGQRSPSLSFAPMRKAISLSGLLRLDKATSASPSCSSPTSSASATLSSYDGLSPPVQSIKRRRRLSLRRPVVSSANSSPSTDASGSNSSKQSKRLSHFHSRRLMSDSLRLDEEEAVTPPRRPLCPAPLLDLDFPLGEMTLYDQVDNTADPSRFHVLRQIAIQCPSEESFQCRGLEEPSKVDGSENRNAFLKQLGAGLPRRRPAGRRPAFTSLLAPATLKIRPRTSFMSMDSDLSSPSSSISAFSFETTQDADDEPYPLTRGGTQATWSTTPLASPHITSHLYSDALQLTLPASPLLKVRLQLILPPTANLASQLTMYVDSNASTLELKETLCSALLRQFNFSISPSNVALLFTSIGDEQIKTLENERPLYQEGLQDDDEIIVRF